MSSPKDKMLIIDDHLQSISRYTRLFSPDFLCLSANDGETGLDVFNHEQPDIVLCDVKMPGGISGFEVCRAIKSTSPETLVVLISSYNNTATRIEGYHSRADNYIDKMMGEKETILQVKNMYCTKKNIPAVFSADETNLKADANIDSFEEIVKTIISDYYHAPLDKKQLKPMDLDYLSQQVYKCDRSIQRDFSGKVACTFTDFHNKIRLSIACQLLTESDRPIGEISEYLCYATPSTFSRQFKSLYGVTPSKYRSNNLL